VGTLITISASSWLTIWLGLEVNLIRVIPILLKNNSLLSSDSTIKYFVIQTVTSLILITAASLNLNNLFFYSENLISKIATIALCIKAAIAPFHLWLTQITRNSEWPQIVILLTWQKIAPLWVLTTIYSELFITQVIIVSAIIGRAGGVLINNTKRILIFSSVVHSSWILSIIFINKLTWIIYTVVYFFLIVYLAQSLFKIKTLFINKIRTLTTRPTILVGFFLSVLSISGLPPLLGFFPKIIVIQSFIINWNNNLIIISLIFRTLIALVFYLKIIISVILKNRLVYLKQNILNKTNIKLIIINALGIFIFLLFFIN